MTLDSFIFSATLILLVASLTVALSKHLGFGSVLGLLIAGILVGPHSPGPYSVANVDDLRHFTELGVVLLLFVIGLEIKPKSLWQLRREMFGLGTLQILVTGFLLTLYMYWVHPTWQIALLLGFTLTLSSTAFVMQLLQDRGEIASKQGSTAFAILLMQDLAIVPLLVLIPLLTNQQFNFSSSHTPLINAILTLTVIILSGRFLIPALLEKLAHQRNREGFLLVVLLSVFASAWGAHQAGLSMALGAFLMGVLLSITKYNLLIQGLVEPYKGLLMTLFFVAVGMSITPHIILEQPFLFLQHTGLIILIKWAVLFSLVLAFGFTRVIAMRVAFLLSQCGEFGFVLLGLAKALGIIDDFLFGISLAVISASMLLTPFLLRLCDHLAQKMEPLDSPVNHLHYAHEADSPTIRAVVAGYGRVGHAVATILHSSGIPFIAFDHNVARVNQGKIDGHPVYYGDISDPQLTGRAHLDDNPLVILTVDHGPTSLRAIRYLRSHYPNLKIIARARDLQACGELLEAGATHAFPEAVESSLRLAANALTLLGVPTGSVDMLLEGVRNGNYELLSPTDDHNNNV